MEIFSTVIASKRSLRGKLFGRFARGGLPRLRLAMTNRDCNYNYEEEQSVCLTITVRRAHIRYVIKRRIVFPRSKTACGYTLPFKPKKLRITR